MKNKRKWNVLMIISGALIVTGLFMAMYPWIENFLYIQQQNQIIEKYNEQIFKPVQTDSNAKSTKNTHRKDNESKVHIDYKRLYRDVRKYNKKIYREKQCNLKSKSSYEASSLNLSDYGFPNSVYGYISIRKINVNMAIYLGASEYNMSQGAAHLSQTSIPLGGKNTNAVIAGHCGYGGREMFRYIENLTNGDEVEITTPFNKLTYKVVQKKTILPNALENIKIQKDKDMITLFTCTPYPTSKYRCCIFCERVKERKNE